MTYLWLKVIHILSSTLLFGTGLGTAFYQWRACRQGDPQRVASVTAEVVLADWLFTTPAVIIQPITGIWMANLLGFPLTTPWLMWSIVLYLVAGACWLPVVWIQLRMRDLAGQAAAGGQPLPAAFHRLFRIWFALGWPAFAAVLAVFYLMVFKPA
jgi:uncharacterized membrane protein